LKYKQTPNFIKENFDMVSKTSVEKDRLTIGTPETNVKVRYEKFYL
jgi:hypothetical protein